MMTMLRRIHGIRVVHPCLLPEESFKRFTSSVASIFPPEATPPPPGALPAERTVFDDPHFPPALSTPCSEASLLAESLARLIVTQTTCDSLLKNGFAVSNVLHGGGDDNNNSKVKSTLIRLRDDIDNLHARGGFHENSTHLAKPGEDGKQARVAKRGVYEAELADDATRIHAPFLYQFAREAHALNSLFGVYCPSLNLKSRGISAKVQRTAAPPPDAPADHHFPMHFDTAEGVDERVLTCLVYLSDDDVEGGELNLMPYPQHGEQTITPSLGTAVLFSSRRMLHATMPIRSGVRRLLTFWLWAQDDGGGVPKAPAPPSLSDEDAVREYLCHPALYRHMLKLHFADAWRAGLLTSHSNSDALVAMHDKEVALLEKVLGQYRKTFADMGQNGLNSVPWF